MLNRIRHAEFATRLDVWKVNVPGLADVVETWAALDTFATDNPIHELRAGLSTGAIGPKTIVKSMRDAAAQFAAADRLAQLLPDVDAVLGSRFANVIYGNADTIVEQLAPHFAKAAGDLTEAVEVLPLGATAEEVLGLGQEVAHAWHGAGNAAQRLDLLAEIRTKLTNVYGYGDSDAPAIAAFLDGPLIREDVNRAIHVRRGDHLALRVNPLPEARGGAWEHLLRGGFRLRLNTATEAAALITTPVAAA